MFFRSGKRVIAPELVTARTIPQQLLLEHAAEVIQTTWNSAETDCDSEGSIDDLPPVDLAQAREDAAVLDLFHSALYLWKTAFF